MLYLWPKFGWNISKYVEGIAKCQATKKNHILRLSLQLIYNNTALTLKSSIQLRHSQIKNSKITYKAQIINFKGSNFRVTREATMFQRMLLNCGPPRQIQRAWRYYLDGLEPCSYTYLQYLVLYQQNRNCCNQQQWCQKTRHCWLVQEQSWGTLLL